MLQRHRAGVDAAMIMQRAQKEVEQAEQDAIKSAEYNLEQARTKATTRRAFSFHSLPLSHRRIFRKSSEYGGYGVGSQLAWFIFTH